MQEFFNQAKDPKHVAPQVENPIQNAVQKVTKSSESTSYTTLKDFFDKPKQESNDGWSDFVTNMTTKSDEMVAEEKALEPYLEKMQPYQHQSTLHNNLFWDNGNGASPNIGWKCHLNIAPENVAQVSAILKKFDLTHKFLLADVDAGKIFTVYLGSKQMTEAVIRLLYPDLKDYLLKPKALGEILFAPKIVGRFCGSKEWFATKAAYKGITLLNVDALKTSDSPEARIAWHRADRVLRSRYGDYYGGLIDSYQPLSTEE